MSLAFGLMEKLIVLSKVVPYIVMNSVYVEFFSSTLERRGG